jgi:hypothetical protein
LLFSEFLSLLEHFFRIAKRLSAANYSHAETRFKGCITKRLSQPAQRSISLFYNCLHTTNGLRTKHCSKRFEATGAGKEQHVI